MTTQVTAVQIATLRRYVAEPLVTPYSDALLTAIIEGYAVLDDNGRMPIYWTSTLPPVATLNPNWVASYDLYAAAAQIWEEKAAVPAADYDFSADGGNFSRSQVYEQAMKQARHYRARRSAKTWTLHPDSGDRSINNTGLVIL